MIDIQKVNQQTPDREALDKLAYLSRRDLEMYIPDESFDLDAGELSSFEQDMCEVLTLLLDDGTTLSDKLLRAQLTYVYRNAKQEGSSLDKSEADLLVSELFNILSGGSEAMLKYCTEQALIFIRSSRIKATMLGKEGTSIKLEKSYLRDSRRSISWSMMAISYKPEK